MFTLQLNVYTVAISSVNKIVINEWLRLNNSGFLMLSLNLDHCTIVSFIVVNAVSDTVSLLCGESNPMTRFLCKNDRVNDMMGFEWNHDGVSDMPLLHIDGILPATKLNKIRKRNPLTSCQEEPAEEVWGQQCL
jgi:hypothetical protein